MQDNEAAGKKKKTEMKVFSCHRERRGAEFKDPTLEASPRLKWNSSGLPWNPLTTKKMCMAMESSRFYSRLCVCSLLLKKNDLSLPFVWKWTTAKDAVNEPGL